MNKLAKHSIFYIGGELLSKALPFLMLPYLTRVLGVEGFGDLSLYIAYQAVFIIFICWSFDGAVARYYYRYGKYNFGNVIIVAFSLTFILGGMLLLFVIIFKQSILIKLAVFSAFLQAVMNIFLSILQCRKEALKYISIQVIFSILSVLLTILLFKVISPTVEVRVIATLLSFLISVFIAFYLIRRIVTLNIYRFDYLKLVQYMLFFGVPLILHQMSFFAKGQFDRVIIAKYYSLSELGIYSAGFQLASIFSVFLMAINKAVVPYFYEACKNRKIAKKNVEKVFLLLILFVPFPSIISYLVPDFLYGLFLGNDYTYVKYYVSVFLLGLALQIPYLVMVNYLYYLGASKSIAISTFISGVFHVFFLFFLVRFGIELLPFSLFLSNLVMLFLLFLLFKKKNIRD